MGSFTNYRSYQSSDVSPCCGFKSEVFSLGLAAQSIGIATIGLGLVCVALLTLLLVPEMTYYVSSGTLTLLTHC